MIRRSVKFLTAICVLLIAFLVACSGIVERGDDQVTRAQIPPIDKYQPAEIETATFALG